VIKKDLEIDDGLIGHGTGFVDTDSEDFKVLQTKIIEEAGKLSPDQVINIHLSGLRCRMEDYLRGESLRGRIETIGQLLRECVEVLKIRNKDFASYLGIEESNLSAILSGRRRISPDFALKLERIFNIPAILWLNIQNKNEILELRKMQDTSSYKLSMADLLEKAGLSKSRKQLSSIKNEPVRKAINQ
jgi:addiction module HigA family antidote